ncbi:glycosyltransferase [Chitinimonas sp. PSY-7]|uniref:glycosyltransferase n=1 Tax=Chitinimonas sp. PSY-7 TaxID=3459088 RepID=UPI00403FD579
MASSPRVAVITAYHRETSTQLARCIESVRSQRYPCTHFLVSDGHPQPWVGAEAVRHVQLGAEHVDYGDTPRAVGSLLALREGFEAICYLDADNYFLPMHVAGLVSAWEASERRFEVLSTRRFFTYPDGRLMPVQDDLAPVAFADTNCLFLTGKALDLTPIWALMPEPFHLIGDRIFWQALQARGIRCAHLPQISVAYTSHWKHHYQMLGEAAPPDAKDIGPGLIEAAHWWQKQSETQRARHINLIGFDPGPALALKLVATAQPD